MNLEKNQIWVIWKFYYRNMIVVVEGKSKDLSILFDSEKKDKNKEKN